MATATKSCKNCRHKEGETTSYCIRLTTKKRLWTPEKTMCNGWAEAPVKDVVGIKAATGSTMTYVCSDGTRFTGDPKNILRILNASAEKIDISQFEGSLPGFYNSKSRGLIKISDMNSGHIRRALAKKGAIYFTNLGAETHISDKLFSEKFIQFAEDSEIVQLFEELTRRF